MTNNKLERGDDKDVEVMKLKPKNNGTPIWYRYRIIDYGGKDRRLGRDEDLRGV